MAFKPVKDEMRQPTSSHEDDVPILALLRKNKTVFVTDLAEVDFRRLYGIVARTEGETRRLRRKKRMVDGEEGHVIWLED